MPALLQKRSRPGASRDAPDGPTEELLADRLYNERVDFARSQGNAQLRIGVPNTSDKAFANLLRKINETSKCSASRQAKKAATYIRAAN